MQQAWRPLMRSKVSLKRFALIAIGFLIAVALSWGQNYVLAQEATYQATANSWQGASFPVENFQGYTSPFGYRMSPDGSYSREFHRGLDMAAPEGSYIRSWWTGRVVEVSDSSACGTSIVIQSGDWQHIYCHMQGNAGTDGRGQFVTDPDRTVQIYEGQMVSAGSRIGRVGMTGRTTGPHLHWGLKYASQWVDPALVLRAMYTEQNGPRSVSSRPDLPVNDQP